MDNDMENEAVIAIVSLEEGKKKYRLQSEIAIRPLT